MKKITWIALLFISTLSFAQDENKKPKEKQGGYDPTNLFTGGSVSFGLSGGYYRSFLAGIHPHFGYTFARWIDAAAVVNFEYYSQRDEVNNKFHNTTYGVGAFTRIFPVDFLFIQAEPEYNFIALKYIPTGGADQQKSKASAPSLLLGAGYTSSRSDKNSFAYLSILLDVVRDANSPYVDGYGNMLPVIRAGINIGLNRSKSSRSRF